MDALILHFHGQEGPVICRGTPNGWKASIFMEELGLEYDVNPIDISSGVQKGAEYALSSQFGQL